MFVVKMTKSSIEIAAVEAPQPVGSETSRKSVAAEMAVVVGQRLGRISDEVRSGPQPGEVVRQLPFMVGGSTLKASLHKEWWRAARQEAA